MLDIERIFIAAEVAKKVLAERVVTLVALLMTFALFAYAMWQPSIYTVLASMAFALFVFLPVLHGGRKAQQIPESEVTRGEVQ